MRIAKRPSELGFNQYDVSRLTRALQCTTDARLFQRVQAVLTVAPGATVSVVAELTGVSEQPVYNRFQRSLSCHQVAALAAAPRSGRPVTAPQITGTHILQRLRCNPLLTRCPFRKSCASMFWVRQGVKSWAGSPHVALSLSMKDIDHACAYCVPCHPCS